MNGHTHIDKLSRLSAHIEELFHKIAGCDGPKHLPPELADEIAATAGEIMIELADHRGDVLARGAIEDARRLRKIVRTLCPEAACIKEAGRVLMCDLEIVIREDKRVA